MWLREQRFKADDTPFRQGYYVFGGVDQKGQVHNDLWLIEPHYEENEFALSRVTHEYINASKNLLSVKMKRLTEYSGRPPCPRIMHSTTVFRDWHKHFHLVVYGGRNDSIFQRTQNVALNDICLFNVHRLEWVALAMYGPMPCSRWSHCLALNRGTGTSGSGVDGFLIFGGVNLKNYCKSKVYQFQFLNSWYVPRSGGQEEEGPSEKLQLFTGNVKQKVELIKELLARDD